MLAWIGLVSWVIALYLWGHSITKAMRNVGIRVAIGAQLVWNCHACISSMALEFGLGRGVGSGFGFWHLGVPCSIPICILSVAYISV
jgi:hypothetical protein